MNWEPITLEELKELGRRIDPEFVVADDLEDLYTQLNTNYPPDKWTMLRAPAWCGNKLVAFVVRPRDDEASLEEDKKKVSANYLQTLEHLEKLCAEKDVPDVIIEAEKKEREAWAEVKELMPDTL